MVYPDRLKNSAVALAFLALSLVGVQPCHALDPTQYESQIHDMALWLIRSTDPSSMDPASPLGVMPAVLPESTMLPLYYGSRVSYGYSRFKPDSSITETLAFIVPDSTLLPERFEVNRISIARGLSRRTTIGAHFIDFPAFSAWGGGLSWERTILRRKPFFATFRMSATYAKSSSWWTYRGALAEMTTGIHLTGFDLFVGAGTRLARIDVPIDDDPGPRAHVLLPFQAESWETHAGAEMFVLKKLAIGGGIHWHPQGYGFSV